MNKNELKNNSSNGLPHTRHMCTLMLKTQHGPHGRFTVTEVLNSKRTIKVTFPNEN